MNASSGSSLASAAEIYFRERPHFRAGQNVSIGRQGNVEFVEFPYGASRVRFLVGPPDYDVYIKVFPEQGQVPEYLDLAALLKNRELMAWAMDNKLSGCRPDDYGAQIDWFLKLLAKARTVAGFEYLD